jgi:hypothetical protein
MRQKIWPYVFEALGVRTLLHAWNVSGRCFALLSGDMKQAEILARRVLTSDF